PQFFWNRSLCCFAEFVRIPHHKLAGLDCGFIAGVGIWTASFDAGIVQSILEAEWVASFRQFAEPHAIDDPAMWEVLMSPGRELQDPLSVLVVLGVDRQRDVYVCGAERIFPVGRRIGTEVMEDRGACRHALSEFDRETVQGCLWYPQRLEALE